MRKIFSHSLNRHCQKSRGVFIFAERVIVPSFLHERVINQFYYAHQVISHNKPSYLFYTKDRQKVKGISTHMFQSLTCSKIFNENYNQFLAYHWISLVIPSHWTIKTQFYCILIAYSYVQKCFRWIVLPLTETILILKPFFSLFVIPQLLISDNDIFFYFSWIFNFLCREWYSTH